ncbi:hypothetical protein Mgra_00002443 [Meloidogyne graminicola]|uniref:Lipid-binding serum glycoprotein C-terminal domain-containing protein n=1 Tax=Meloidogyne graminicola TaxID=189291 RepID=A0A8S9ZZ96_9BILA|nr:hypothetical protein Mgra_00002443 [Meloidogyne graminicola]
MLFILQFVLAFLFCFSFANFPTKDDADIGMSIGDSAATKLVKSAVEHQLRSPHLIKLKLQSAEDVWFHDVVKLDSKNRISIGSLNVRFPSNKIIEAESRQIILNSSFLVNDASLPLFFLDRKNVIMDVEIDHAFIQLRVEQQASLYMENCSIELKNINLAVEKTFLVSTVLNAFGNTLSNGIVKDKVCDMLQIAVLHLRREFSIELPFKLLIPEKFIRHLQNDRVILRSRVNSINAVANQIAITVVMEWKLDEVPTTEHTSFDDTDVLHLNETKMNNLQNSDEQKQQNSQKIQSPQMADFNSTSVSEEILIWVEDRLINDLLKQFRWDTQWINESIQLNSPRLPKETLDFFEVVCPQCFFLFNISANGLPNVQILADKSIIIRSNNRITAAVLNPTLGHSGKRRTAIDLSMLLQLRLVPQIQNGKFRTHLELMERKVEVQKESAFPSELYGAVEQLIQGKVHFKLLLKYIFLLSLVHLIAEDMWPLLQRELEPLIYQSGIQLPTRCGLDPISAQLHFEQGRLGVSAKLENNLEEVSFNQCLQQFKSGLPDASKLFNDLSNRHKNKIKRFLEE